MKRILTILATVLMFGIVAYAPYGSPNPSEALPGRHTPTPAPVTLTAPALLSPANGATIHPGNLVFSWTSVPGAARYHIQAGGSTNFDESYNIIEYWSLTSPSYTFNVTSGFIVYFPHLYWRVQAIDANNVQGPWSEVRTINLVNP